MIGDGPMVTGTWYNPKTGHSFTAKDTYFEDDKMYVITTDGQRLDYNMLSQYVQSNKPEEDRKDFANQPKPAASVLPPEVAAVVLPPTGSQPEQPANFDDSLLTPEDKALLAGERQYTPMSEAKPRPELNLPAVNAPVEDEDDLLVRRLLKRAPGPDVTCSVVFEKFPREQMRMLDMMGVDPEKIADYYMKDVNLQSIQEIIRQTLTSTIEKLLADQGKSFQIVTAPAVLTEEESKERGLDHLEGIVPGLEFKPETAIENKTIKKAPVKRTVKKPAKSSKKTTKK